MKKLHLLLTILIVSMGCAFAQNEEDPWQEYKQLEYEYDNESMTATLIGQYRIDWNNPNTWIGKCVVPEYVEHDGKTYTVNAIGKDAFHNIKTRNAYLSSSITKVNATAFASNYYDSSFGDERVLICDTVHVPYLNKWFSGEIYGNLNELTPDAYYPRFQSPQRIPQYLGPIQDLPVNKTTYALFEDDKLAPSIFTGENRFGGANYPIFSNCMLVRNIEEIEFDESVKGIPDLAFLRCRNMKSVVFPEELDSIGYRSFQDCTSLQEVIWPKSLKSLGASAFNNCINLSDVSLPSSLTKIGSGAFQNSGIKQFPLAEGLEILENSVFWNCDKATNIVLPSTLKHIGYCAFYGCPVVDCKKLIIPESVAIIEGFAFGNGFYNVLELVMPQHLDSLEPRAFGEMDKLEKIVIPQSIDKLITASVGDAGYFYRNAPITDVYCYSSTLPNYDISVLLPSGNRYKATIHIPKGCLNLYQTAYPKLHFVESLDAGVEELEQEAFDASLPVELIGLTGVSMGTFPDLQTAEASVAPGIYICRQGINVQKVAIR